MAVNPTSTPPAILSVNPDGIPQYMRQLKRWCVWVATWIPERGKYDKRPVHPITGVGLSSRRPDDWATFEQAMSALKRSPNAYAGVGFVLDKRDGITVIDADKCMASGQPDARATDVVHAVQSFTEYSPSGQGIHTWARGTVERDCAAGIEVYAGNTPRFVTVTGRLVAGAPHHALREVPTPVLQSVIDAYGRKSTTAEVINLEMPELLDELALPSLDELELPPTVLDFLQDGDTGTRDRSLMLWHTAVALHQAGLDTQQVISLMISNAHSYGAALEKRGGDDDKAVEYLWLHHAQKAKPRADAARVTLDDFDLEGPPPTPAPAEPTSGFSADDFDNVADPAVAAPPQHKGKFAFTQIATYVREMLPTRWLVRGVLPQAEVGVCFGPSGGGKSFFVIDLCMAIATGQKWCGRAVRKGRVAYVVAEGARGFKLRLEAYAEHHDVDMPEVPFYALAGAPNLLDKGDTKALIEALKVLGPLDVIVIDTMAQVTPGADENSGQDMGRMLAHCKALHRATGAMVLLVGHSGKDTTKGLRGWSGMRGAVDVEIEIERSGNARAATIQKMKDGEGEGVEFPFRLDIVKLGEEIDPDTGEVYDITSCVLHHGKPVAVQAKREPLSGNQPMGWEALQKALELADGELPEASAEAAIAPHMSAKEAKERTKSARRVIRALVQKGYITTTGGLVRATSGAEDDTANAQKGADS